MSKSLLAALTLAAAVSAMSLPAAPPALACGDSEAGGCGENGAADDARWLLKRAVAAVKANEAKALTEFSKGEDGFRTQDLYVFCIGTDGKMTAHPDAGLLGKDAREFQDPTGKRFGAEILDVAKEGSIHRSPLHVSASWQPRPRIQDFVRDARRGPGLRSRLL
jgi:hypothetical protein